MKEKPATLRQKKFSDDEDKATCSVHVTQE